MLYRTYGKTGIEVSAIGFGGMRFENQDDVDACASLLKRAYDEGITYFDTAPGYGKSEDLFGVALKEMKKTRAEKPFYVATKTTKSKPDDIRKDLETSLKRMDLDYIDFYHVWCILSLDAYEKRKVDGLLQEFERIKEEGLIKHICVSTHMGGKDTGIMLNDYSFAGVLLGYSAMNFSFRDEGISAAAALDNGVVVMNPLGGGIIPQYPDRFGFVRTRQEETIVEGALRFLINDPRITVSLVGFANEKQLEEALRAVDGYQPIPTEKIEHIRDSIHDYFDELCTGCQYCDQCPEGLPIPKLMDAYNQLILRNDTKKMIGRLRYHWGIDLDKEDWLNQCHQCGVCEDACTQKLPISDRLDRMKIEIENYQKAAAQGT